MRLSLNEHEDAEMFLSELCLGKDAFEKLKIIARYYMDEGRPVDSVRDKLKEYVANCGESFTLNPWRSMIELALKSAKKYNAVLINELHISKPEMERISKIKGIQARRFCFVLLCLKKYFNAIRPENNGWVCVDHADLMRLANIKTPMVKQAELYRILLSENLIELPDKPDRVAIHVVFDDMEGDDAMCITDMRNLGNQYMMYLGEPYYQCQECGLVVRNPHGSKGTKPFKYCKDCAAKIKIRQSTESAMKKYYKDISNFEVKIVEV